jgi:hypothetical protein
MIFTPESVLRQRIELIQKMECGELTESAVVDRLLEIDPDLNLPYVLKGRNAFVADDLDAAEEWIWKGIDRQPCHYFGYWSLADVRMQRTPGDALATHLRYIAFRKLSYATSIPDATADRFSQACEDAGLDPHDPGTYEEFAAAELKHLEQAVLTDEQRDLLLPYELLDELQDQALSEVDSALIGRIRENGARMVPLLCSAMRVWREDIFSLRPPAMMCMTALLGEMGPVDLIDDLLEIALLEQPQISMHIHWAMQRLASRFPAEALEKFRAAGRGAGASLRCAIAEQLVLMEHAPGREDALAELLDGFSAISNAEDAAYLLLTVCYGLEEADQEDRIERLLPGCEAALSRKARKVFRKLVESESAPAMMALGIDELDIEAVCCDRALMDGDVDDIEEDYAEEDDEEFERVKPGRNDPCWCGSGKKYKKCHLTSDEEKERARREGGREREREDTADDGEFAPEGKSTGDPLHKRLMDFLAGAAVDWRGRAESREAQKLYFGDGNDAEQQDLLESGFFEWFLYDYRPRRTGKTMVEEYLERRGASLSAQERALLEAWRAARYGLYEVQRVEEGTGIELKDVFEGDVFFVHDVSSSRELVSWDAIFSRVEEWEGRRLFTGNGVIVPRRLLPEIVSQIETESRDAGQRAAEYVRANSHRWYRLLRDRANEKRQDLKIVTAEGDDLEFCSATYTVRDQAAVADRLSKAGAFEETTNADDAPGVRRFGWLEAVKGPRRSYGSIELSTSELRLECTSRRRLEIGRQLIQKSAGEWLQHRGDSFKSVDALRKEASRGGRREQPENKLPPQVEREIIQKYKAEHYSTWADQPLPALEGKTPRQAVKSAVGRRAVEELLRDFENGEERNRKRGAAAFDFGEIRKSLGLAPKG